MKRLPLIWLTLWIGAALISVLLGESPYEHRLDRILSAPSWSHPFGTDGFGRDLLLITLRSSFTSMSFAGLAVIASCAVALLVGALVATSSRGIRSIGLRVIEFTLAFPSLLLALAWAALRGPGWNTLAISLMLGTLPSFTRLIFVRSEELLSEEFVLAARSLGAGPVRIVRTHLSPHLLSLCSVKLPNLFAHALMAEATLSFLGIGAPVGRDTWGALLAQGKEYLFEAPHVAIVTGVPLVLSIVALQFLTPSKRQN